MQRKLTHYWERIGAKYDLTPLQMDLDMAAFSAEIRFKGMGTKIPALEIQAEKYTDILMEDTFSLNWRTIPNDVRELLKKYDIDDYIHRNINRVVLCDSLYTIGGGRETFPLGFVFNGNDLFFPGESVAYLNSYAGFILENKSYNVQGREIYADVYHDRFKPHSQSVYNFIHRLGRLTAYREVNRKVASGTLSPAYTHYVELYERWADIEQIRILRNMQADVELAGLHSEIQELIDGLQATLAIWNQKLGLEPENEYQQVFFSDEDRKILHWAE